MTNGLIVPIVDVEFRVTDYLPDLSEEAGPADASGILDCVFEGPDAGEWWLIDRIVVACTSLSPTTVAVFAGDAQTRNLRDGTTAGNGNVADEFQPIVIAGPRQVLVRWTGADLGAGAFVNVQVRRTVRATR